MNKKLKIILGIAISLLAIYVVIIRLTPEKDERGEGGRTATEFFNQNSGTATNDVYLPSGQHLSLELAAPASLSVATGTDGSLSTSTDTNPNNRYFFKVVASDGVGTTTAASEVNCELKSKDSADGCILSWTASTGADSYKVFFATSSFGGADLVKYLTATATDSYHFTTTTVGATTGLIPTETSAFVNTISATGDSHFLAGNIGIGTTSVSDILEVYDSSATSTIFINSGSSGLGGSIIFEHNDGSGCTEVSFSDTGMATSSITCP